MKHILLSLVTRALNCVLLGDLSIELSGIFKTSKPIYLPFFSKYLKFVFLYSLYTFIHRNRDFCATSYNNYQKLETFVVLIMHFIKQGHEKRDIL